MAINNLKILNIYEAAGISSPLDALTLEQSWNSISYNSKIINSSELYSTTKKEYLSNTIDPTIIVSAAGDESSSIESIIANKTLAVSTISKSSILNSWDYFVENSSDPFVTLMKNAGSLVVSDIDLSDETYSDDWVTVEDSGEDLLLSDVISGTTSTINNITSWINGLTGLNIGTIETDISSEDINALINNIYGTASSAANSLLSDFSDKLSGVAKYIGSGNGLTTTISNIVNILADMVNPYKDGVTETTFGSKMEESWSGSNGLWTQIKTGNVGGFKTTLIRDSLFDTANSSMYGNKILGCPFQYTEITDPNNRNLINTFIKDSKFLSLTPGLPVYHGGEYGLQGTYESDNNILSQTQDGASAIKLLMKNGLGDEFTEKDKRYYTFGAKYEEYYAYLETMLNATWLKMGLGNNPNSSKNLNIYSFFDDGGNLSQQYKSSLGFFVDISGAVQESISNTPNSAGSEAKGLAETSKEKYQKMNYITGMGTGGGILGASRAVGNIATSLTNFKSNIIEPITVGVGSWEGITAKIKNIVTIASNVTDMISTTDFGALTQSFTLYNGMGVEYPNLWGDASYSKSVSFNFNFVSPYGDPLSIYQYVYMPFLALCAFAMPRQAASNGYVSPFYVRADIPGLFTVDLGMISSINWTKGGDSNLWTKDGLPRAISGQITIDELYPYMPMTKRLSFLSANPSMLVWLDNMAGMSLLYSSDSDDSLNTYFKNLVNRVNGLGGGSSDKDSLDGLWNVYNSSEKYIHKDYLSKSRKELSKSINKSAMPFLSNRK